MNIRILGGQLLCALCTSTLLSSGTLAHDTNSKRIDSHAPIGVMADHFHKKGELMASLRGMTMDMNDPVSTTMGPQSMTMNMAMLGLMYAPSDTVTFMGMINYVDISMDMIMMGNTQKMGASNIGDLTLNAMIALHDSKDSRFHITLGASVPTGSTKGTNSMGSPLALTMQTGTGSWGFTPSATYTKFMNGWSFGAQANAKIWLDDTANGERMGDQFELTSWAAFMLNDAVSFSTRAAYSDRSAVSGSMMSALTDARQVAWGYAGFNTIVGAGHRLAVEAGLPIWQDKNANALDMGLTLTVGWQKAF